MPVTEAWTQYPLDTEVALWMEGYDFWDDVARKSTGSKLDEAKLFDLEYCKLRHHGSHVIAVFFTEETPAEIQAKLDAMQPLERLAYEIGRAAPSKPLIPSFKSVIGDESPDSARLLTDFHVVQLLINPQIRAFCLAQADGTRFVNLVAEAKNKLGLLEGDTKTNSSIVSALTQNL